MKEQNTNLPDYLKDLAEPTTIGRAKLLAIWDELNLDNQIELLASIKDDYKTPYFEVIHRLKNGEPSPGKIPNQEDLNQELLLKALGSDNEYVRHLAANQLYRHGSVYHLTPKSDWTKINTLIDNDKSNLVKYTKYLEHWSFPEDFFKLPLVARLIIVSSEKTVNFFMLTEVIKKANEKGFFKPKERETELNQVLWELLNNPEKWKEEETSEGTEYVNPSLHNALDELWKLLPYLPESSGLILVEKLPISFGSIPDGIFNQLTINQQNKFFGRRDFKMFDIRREFYFQDADTNNDNFWHTAPLYHLTFSDEEFSEILNKPEKERDSRLKLLAFANDMSLHHHLMVRLLVKYEYEEEYQAEMQSELIKRALENYYKELELDDGTNLEFIDEYLYKYRLLSAAWRSKRWTNETEAPFSKLFKERIDNDIWATYLAFYSALEYLEPVFQDLPIGAFERNEDIPISLRNPEPAEVPYESSYDVLNEKIDLSRIQILNKIKERAILIILVLAVFIMFWDR